MRRRSFVSRHQKASGTSGPERWLVSYADYMTLVFALFVVLYAINASKTEHKQPMLDGIEQALVRLNGKPEPTDADSLMIMQSENKEALNINRQLKDIEAPLSDIKAQLALALPGLLQQESVVLEEKGDWLIVSFDGKLLFASGSALLGANAKPLLSRIIPALTVGTHFIRVRGYADNLPVNNELYASNWQLSAERARAVLEWLLHEGINAPRLALEAYGEFQAPDSQLAVSSRAQSRRVDIAISSQQWQAPAALPSRPLATEKNPDLRVYELPNGGIRIGTTQE
ncbi:flagellar motor protein MotB [Oceanisphaera pacifica]|uniref:OmpA family protein n=1 Tax=Oceanisphaera pacifica TaxID=2818389 RepID=A0ABS3NFL2_9GAMM|nr:flagellar motor protein MotB [Oceanisphaera pacifica]MBO1519167.1 OmpA family protein [Oceanisphaera pacifica]